jgi:putative oxidoreductase
MKDIVDLLARICIAIIFLYEAYDSIAYYQLTKEKMTAYGLTWQQDTLLMFAIIFLIVGGVFLLFGYRASFAAILLLMYWIPLTFIVHSFWNDPREIQRVQSIFFMRNIAIAGGLMMVWVHGSGRFSVKRLLDRQRIKTSKLT